MSNPIALSETPNESYFSRLAYGKHSNFPKRVNDGSYIEFIRAVPDDYEARHRNDNGMGKVVMTCEWCVERIVDNRAKAIRIVRKLVNA